MGGTTADVALVIGGEPQLRYRGRVGRACRSTCRRSTSLSIGAGGGSIARVDAVRRRSPSARESAGADPARPRTAWAASEATVTDAHVVLGTLDAGAVLGRPARARRRARPRGAIERASAEPLGLSVEDAARGDRARRERQRWPQALRRDLRRPRPRPAPLRARRARRRRPDARLRHRRRARRRRACVIPRWPGITAALGLLGLGRAARPRARLRACRPTAALGTGELDAAPRRRSRPRRGRCSPAHAAAAALVARHALPRAGVQADRAAAGAAGHRRRRSPRAERGVPRRAPPAYGTTRRGADRDRHVRCACHVALPAPGHHRARPAGAARPAAAPVWRRRRATPCTSASSLDEATGLAGPASSSRRTPRSSCRPAGRGVGARRPARCSWSADDASTRSRRRS